MSDLGPVIIGAREIYDQGLETRRLVQQIDGKITGVSAELADHEARLRLIERSRWPLSPATVVTGLIAVVSLAAQFIPGLK